MKEYKITAREISIDIGDCNFLCAFGNHINGGWVSIINWGVSAELSSYGDVRYNTNRIYATFVNANVDMSDNTKMRIAKGISEVISPLIMEMNL